MVSLKVSTAVKPPAFAHGFPLTIEVKITVKGNKKPLANETEVSTVLGANLQDGKLQVKIWARKSAGGLFSSWNMYVESLLSFDAPFPMTFNVLQIDWSFNYLPTSHYQRRRHHHHRFQHHHHPYTTIQPHTTTPNELK